MKFTLTQFSEESYRSLYGFYHGALEAGLEVDMKWWMAEPGVVVHSNNSSTRDSERGGKRVWCQCGLHNGRLFQK
jgi:hypothetical protein